MVGVDREYAGNNLVKQVKIPTQLPARREHPALVNPWRWVLFDLAGLNAIREYWSVGVME